MYTEDEARRKWCPFASVDVSRLSDEELAERTQGFHGENVWSQACIASECMAWRWANKWRNADGMEIDFYQPPTDEKAIRFGYCGLSGRGGDHE